MILAKGIVPQLRLVRNDQGTEVQFRTVKKVVDQVEIEANLRG